MSTKKQFAAYWSDRLNVIGRFMCRVVAVNVTIGSTLLFAAGNADGHEFEDGFIERSVAVVVRDNVARLEYSIGLNPSTRRELIEFWQTTSQTEVESNEKTEAAQDADFLQLAATQLSRRLVIRVDNQRLQPKLISTLRSSRHHVDATVTLEFELPSAEVQVPIKVEIADGNFLCRPPDHPQPTGSVTEKINQDVAKQRKIGGDNSDLLPAPFAGGFRYAFKTAGCTVLSRSNVASILIRAERHLDANYSQAELDIAFKIKAEVAYIQRTQTERQP